MREYFIISVGLLAILLITELLIFKTGFLKKWKSLTFTCFVGFILTFLFDTISLYRQFWVYTSRYLLGLKIGSVPLETFILALDIIFCFVMLWEWKKIKD